MMTRNLLFSLLSIGLAAGCGASAGDESAAYGGGGQGPTASQKSDENGDPALPLDPGVDEPEPFIPEEEIDAELQVPQSGDRFVFVVSTGLDAVVRIDAITLAVDLVEVGGQPTEMRTLAGEDSLVVINRGTQDFSVVRNADDPDAAPQVTTIDSPGAVNRIEVSASGAYAVAWFDPDAEDASAVGDLQEVQVLRLTPGAEGAWAIGVGFHPLSVTFADKKALVVSEAGVSTIVLADVKGPDFAPPLSVTPDPFEPWFDREVLITPDGKRAVVRRGGIAELRVIDLATEEAETLELPGPPTDVDLTADAKEAIVVVRDKATLLRVPLSDLKSAETIDLSGTPAGLATLTPDGSKAILHSTLPDSEWVAVLDLADGTVAAFPLKKGVRSIAPAPDGKSVLIIHDKADGSPIPGEELEDFIDKSEGYSVLDVKTGFVKLQLTDSPPGGLTMTPDGDRAYVMVPDTSGGGTAHVVDDIDLRAMLVTPRHMGSPPQHAVYVPAAERVAVSQDHPVGRITFIDTKSGATETVTGFELNGLIE